MTTRHVRFVVASFALVACGAAAQTVLTGKAAFTDYTKEAPGVRRHLTVADLPEPCRRSQ